MVRRRPAALAAWVLAAGAIATGAPAQVLAGAPNEVSVTIYRDRLIATSDIDTLDPSQGLALVTETRTVDIPAAGRVRIAFRGVADTMVPETAAVTGLPGAVVERNEDYDLLTPSALIAHSLGQSVRVVQTGPGKARSSERSAVLRSGLGGVLLDFGTGVEVLGCGGPPTRLVFDRAPPDLSEKPTFSVLADAPTPGRYTVRLSYLATGFSWSADYMAHIRADGRTLDLAGWLTLANKSSAGFADAPTQVVAGDLQRDASTVPPQPQTVSTVAHCWGIGDLANRIAALAAPAVERRFAGGAGQVEEIVVTGSKRMAVQSELGDYKLYTLPEPTTVAARQTKQVAFLDQRAVPFERVYVYRLETYAGPGPEDINEVPDVVLRLQNDARSGLGKPLPGGAVSVLERGGDGPVLAGQQTVVDTPVGLPLELTLGRAMDIAVQPRLEKDLEAADVHTVTLSVSVANDKPEPIVLEYRQPPQGRDFRLVSASQPATTKAGDMLWILRLRAGGRAQLRYTLSFRD